MSSRSPASIREDTQKHLAALSTAERSRLSAEICRRWIASAGASSKLSAKLSGMVVGLYRALPRELELNGVEEFLREKGARLHYPRLRAEDGKMEFVHVPADSSEWKKGPYGFEQPHEHLPALDSAQLQLVFVPGIALGEKGERVGRGKGYFDRFLPSAPKAVRVALAFDFQLYPSLEQEEWDQPMHWILTEKREIQLAPALSWLKET